MNLVDSCGWLEYLAEGPNAGFFSAPLQDFEHLVVPTICVYEVYRRVAQQQGTRLALTTLATMKRATVVELSVEIALAAASLGERHKLALADSIILATARQHNATLWTQDAHFEGMEGVSYRAKP